MNPLGSSPLVGMVCWWPFDVADIPDGWLLCDGENGTVDMRGLTALGAPAGVDSGAVVGSDSHRHDNSILSGRRDIRHSHPLTPASTPALDGSFNVTNIGGAHRAFNVHIHDFSGTVGLDHIRHRHSSAVPTEFEDSKQLSREQIFIMKT